MMKLVRYYTVLSAFLILGACGFKPMYGQFSDSENDLHQIMASIQIDDIRERDEKGVYRNSRVGQLIRNDLIDRITGGNDRLATEYTLKVDYFVEEAGYGIRADESVTLQNLKLLVTYELRTIQTDKPVLSARARGLVTYDLVQSDYSNMIARKSAMERLSKEVANQITTRIGTYLSRLPAKKSDSSQNLDSKS